MSLSKWYKWGFYKQGDGSSVIRRYRKVNGKIKWESYPKTKYKDLSEEEIEALVRRLNASFESEEIAAKARYDYQHAFINVSAIEEFERRLTNRAESLEHIQTQMAMLNTYVFTFFINKRKIADPNHWKRIEDGFGEYLLNIKSKNKRPLGGTYISRIIQTANRFLQFLHEYMPNEVKLIKLDPISDTVLKGRDSNSVNKKRKKFISEKEYLEICRKVDKRILPLVQLGYLFGLRRAETLGLKIEDVFEDALNVDRQLTRVSPIPHYSKLKDKEERVIPYWYSSPEQAYEIISNVQLIHPDSVSDLFSRATKELNLPFQFHDLRRTWITRALREHNYMDVKLAAGHEDLETLQKYIQDDREINRKRFVPKRLKEAK